MKSGSRPQCDPHSLPPFTAPNPSQSAHPGPSRPAPPVSRCMVYVQAPVSLRTAAYSCEYCMPKYNALIKKSLDGECVNVNIARSVCVMQWEGWRKEEKLRKLLWECVRNVLWITTVSQVKHWKQVSNLKGLWEMSWLARLVERFCWQCRGDNFLHTRTVASQVRVLRACVRAGTHAETSAGRRCELISVIPSINGCKHNGLLS